MHTCIPFLLSHAIPFLQVITEHQPELPELQCSFPLASYFIYGSVYMERVMAPHFSTLAWKIPWMEEPGRLQSTGSLRVGHNWAASLSLFTFMHWRRKWQPTPVFLPGEFQRWRSLVGCHLWGRTRLKWLSSSSSSSVYMSMLLSQFIPPSPSCLESTSSFSTCFVILYKQCNPLFLAPWSETTTSSSC